MKLTSRRMSVPLEVTLGAMLTAQDQLPRVEQEAAKVAVILEYLSRHK